MLVHVHRMLLLARRFHALCELRPDPRDMAETLQRVIATWCDGSRLAGSLCPAEWAGIACMLDERARCLRDLETLLDALERGEPDLSGGLRHALDGVLVQCVVLDAIANSRRDDPD